MSIRIQAFPRLPENVIALFEYLFRGAQGASLLPLKKESENPMEGAIRLGAVLIFILFFVLQPMAKRSRLSRLPMIGHGLLYAITLVTVLLDQIGFVQVPWPVRAMLIAATLLYQGVLIVFFSSVKREKQRNAVPSGR
jgi:hypothetical protein